ncbi:MAG: 30S ribosomal protein S9 [Verrucomicrobiales bacterium]
MSTDAINATGRRKTSIARIQMKPGAGTLTVNDKPMEEYFPTVQLQNSLLYPLHVADSAQKFDVSIIAQGGGVTGQVGAIRLALARALLKVDADLRPTLKAEGLLTRDPRMKERKKPGQPGARKRFQFSKR